MQTFLYPSVFCLQYKPLFPFAFATTTSFLLTHYQLTQNTDNTQKTF